MLGLKTYIIMILLMGCPATAFSEIVTIDIPEAGWGISFDAPHLSEPEDSRRGSDYAFRALSDHFNISIFLEEPAATGNMHTDSYNFYWSRASQNPNIEIPSIATTETPAYVRVQYTSTLNFQGQTYRQKHVNYYFAYSGKWVDVHISIINPTSSDESIFKTFDQSLSYTNFSADKSGDSGTRR